MIKGESELAVEELVAYYFDMPYYILTIEAKDQKEKRSFLDIKKEVDNILNSFSKWLIDIQRVKVTNPIFDAGYINGNEVDALGRSTVGSGYVKAYQFFIPQEISPKAIEDILKVLDNKDVPLNYLKNKESYFEKRRELFLSRDIIGGFVSLYGFLQEIIGASTQREIDDYIRNQFLLVGLL